MRRIRVSQTERKQIPRCARNDNLSEIPRCARNDNLSEIPRCARSEQSLEDSSLRGERLFLNVKLGSRKNETGNSKLVI